MDLRGALRRRRAAELTVDPLIDVALEFAGAVSDAVGKDYNAGNRRLERHLRSYMAERVDMINRTTRERLQKAVEADDPVAAVRQVFADARDRRARMIAETEVVRTSNWAATDAGKWVGQLQSKRWASLMDGRERHTHHELHGQVVGWTDDFVSPSGAHGPGPGQFGVADEDIGCRCAALPAKPGQRRGLEEYGDAVELYEEVRKPFVDDLERSWRAVFDEQEAALLADL